jgi:hypothetical protein
MKFKEFKNRAIGFMFAILIMFVVWVASQYFFSVFACAITYVPSCELINEGFDPFILFKIAG